MFILCCAEHNLIGVPHHLTEDDEYEGCFLPEDTPVVTNLWYHMCYIYTLLIDGIL